MCWHGQAIGTVWKFARVIIITTALFALSTLTSMSLLDLPTEIALISVLTVVTLLVVARFVWWWRRRRRRLRAAAQLGEWPANGFGSKPKRRRESRIVLGSENPADW